MKHLLLLALTAQRLTTCRRLPMFIASRWLALLLLAGRLPAAAQAPAWQSAQAVAVPTAANTYSVVRATVADAAGNVYLVGSFSNTVVLGSTTLTSLGGGDVFVAKFNPASNQFTWAQRAGGAGDDYAYALAVSGTSVYVAGEFSSSTAGFGATTLTKAGTSDGFVAKLTDAGATAGFSWAQRVGGAGTDRVDALAVSGASLYVVGGFEQTAAFGPTSLTSAGTLDVFVAKFTDAGTSGSFAWAQQGGGTSNDEALALAVSGANVYVAGFMGSGAASFGATTLPAASTSASPDAFVAKLTDAGATAGFVWAQRAGGANTDAVTALAVSGSNVYVAGQFGSATAGASFGSLTLTGAGLFDAFVAKLTDAGSTGSFVWAQPAGGAGPDRAYALAVRGSSVYVAGQFDSATASFGPATLTSAGGSDVYVAKVTDAGATGSFAWAQQGGGPGGDQAYALAVSGTSVQVAGIFSSATANFGAFALSNPAGAINLGYLASLTDPTLTATTAGRAQSPAQLYPNPARHTATLRLPAGTPPAPLTLTDAQGRTVRRYPAPISAETTLDLQCLPAGLYLLRGAGLAQSLAVE